MEWNDFPSILRSLLKTRRLELDIKAALLCRANLMHRKLSFQ